MRRRILLAAAALLCCSLVQARDTYNFNPRWLLRVGDSPEASSPSFDDKAWQEVTLPHAFNEDEAFKLDIHDLTDTVVWYRKHFRLPSDARGRKVFVEFEGARQGVDVYVNGQAAGSHENGVMAFGLDLTPYVKVGAENVIAVRVDNNWEYAERSTGVKYQWSNRNFNANYGGLPKNVWLHITDPVYQTLPLYSNLGTTGVYIYASDIDVKAGSAVINAESEVRNETSRSHMVGLNVSVRDPEGRLVASFGSDAVKVDAGQTAVVKACEEASGLHFWSWGYGYLYTVTTTIVLDRKATDSVTTRTGFRKTRFAEGKIWLNDRVIQVKGYAQRTSNEWPALGMSVPAWLSDYSNDLMVKSGANTVRWMHVTPWKQDIESCDRVGLSMSMQAGDAEKDCTGRQWEQRKLLMRDAIIYNRNNPSILYYECGNESISREHMIEMKQIRDTYDPHGGRAIGSREMLDIREAEYGGEMLYINKSCHSPMWAMEYCRDEGLRKYWDEQSYPYHKEGEGPDMIHSAASNTARKMDPAPYNHNQDEFALENLRRWYDYWRERPGSGTRVSSGGVNIIFSDSNTHFRGVENYRRSGVVDPMRIYKDSWFVHQVMWDGWVDVENPRIYIIGHWNYPEGTVKNVYVVSSAERVELLRDGEKLGEPLREYEFLYTFKDVAFEPGTLEAVGYNGDKEVCRYTLKTAGEPKSLRLKAITDPSGWKADGADVALLEIEVVDASGQRCPLANNMIHYELSGPAEWRGGIAQGPDNYILARDFPVECGVNRAFVRSTTRAGQVCLKASAEGLESASITLRTEPFEENGGLSTYIPGDHLVSRLDRGPTPEGPSYTDWCTDVPIAGAVAGYDSEGAALSFDDNELSEWKNDGRLQTAWIRYSLGREATVDEVCLKLTGWRMRSYPLEIYAGDQLVWSGDTPRSLGYVHLSVKPVPAGDITIRLKGSAEESDAFSGIVEVTEPAAGELDLFKAKGGANQGNELRIVEIEFKEHLR